MSEEIASGIGFGVVILALCLGIGGCNYMTSTARVKEIDAMIRLQKERNQLLTFAESVETEATNETDGVFE